MFETETDGPCLVRKLKWGGLGPLLPSPSGYALGITTNKTFRYFHQAIPNKQSRTTILHLLKKITYKSFITSERELAKAFNEHCISIVQNVIE